MLPLSLNVLKATHAAQWLDACLEIQGKALSSVAAKGGGHPSPPAAVPWMGAPLAAVTGGSSVQDRERCAEEVAKRADRVAGEFDSVASEPDSA